MAKAGDRVLYIDGQGFVHQVSVSIVNLDDVTIRFDSGQERQTELSRLYFPGTVVADLQAEMGRLRTPVATAVPMAPGFSFGSFGAPSSGFGSQSVPTGELPTANAFSSAQQGRPMFQSLDVTWNGIMDDLNREFARAAQWSSKRYGHVGSDSPIDPSQVPIITERLQALGFRVEYINFGVSFWKISW